SAPRTLGRSFPSIWPNSRRADCAKGLVSTAKGVSIGIAFQKRIGVGLFGGEGLFFATLRGPGRIWLQSLPLSRLAGRIVAAAPQTGRGGREEGSILGGIGRLLDGDNR